MNCQVKFKGNKHNVIEEAKRICRNLQSFLSGNDITYCVQKEDDSNDNGFIVTSS